MGPAAAPAPALAVTREGEAAALALSGTLRIGTVDGLRPALAQVPSGLERAEIDLSEVSALDTAGAWLVCGLRRRLEAAGTAVSVTGAAADHAALLETVAAAMPGADVPHAGRAGFLGWVEDVGRNSARMWAELLEILSFTGEFMARLAGLMLRPWRFRMTALVSHMQQVGLAAVPIVSLMAFLVGVVLAYQGATQLRQFGAEVFVVDLIAISVLRELGILLTAIIVAGRTASAFTSAIGSMKIREEIDAMRVLGLDPMEVLVVPRVVALVLTLPILGFVADIVGLIGGAVMSWIELGVSPGMFRTRLIDGVDVTNYLIGLVKAPFFALIIGIVGCYQGLKVEGNAESLGRLTSKSVVMAIFMVIVMDAVFSIFFAVIGL